MIAKSDSLYDDTKKRTMNKQWRIMKNSLSVFVRSSSFREVNISNKFLRKPNRGEWVNVVVFRHLTCVNTILIRCHTMIKQIIVYKIRYFRIMLCFCFFTSVTIILWHYSKSFVLFFFDTLSFDISCGYWVSARKKEHPRELGIIVTTCLDYHSISS